MLSKRITIIFFLNLTIFSFAQCKTTKNKTAQDQSSLQSSIQQMKNDITISKLNNDKSMELSLRKRIKQGDPAVHFEYIVYNTKTKEIIKQGTYRGSNIDWNDNMSLKLVPYVGMEQKPSSENPDDTLLSNINTQITIIKLKTNL